MATAGSHAIGDISSTWNGTSWSVLARPPSKGDALAFKQVSCPQPSFCVAVDGGAHINGSSADDRGSAVFTWSNGTWSGPQLIDPTGYFSALSCTPDDLCAAGDTRGGTASRDDRTACPHARGLAAGHLIHPVPALRHGTAMSYDLAGFERPARGLRADDRGSLRVPGCRPPGHKAACPGPRDARTRTGAPDSSRACQMRPVGQ